MVETKFKQVYTITIKGDEYRGIGLGDICGINAKDYAVIEYQGNVSLVKLDGSNGSLEGTFVDWNAFSNSREDSCKDFCEYLLKKQGLLSPEAA